jgi:TnpA family transposase
VEAMMEGVLRHCTEMTVERQYVDSHGQSEIRFAFSHLMGFQLLPRLKSIARQKLYRPDTGAPDCYARLQPVLTRTIRWDLIRQQYDERWWCAPPSFALGFMKEPTTEARIT